jgi:hypothetical protein
MTLYRGVRYHLKEQRLAEQKPQNAKELFNLRHLLLRNVIERIFGVLKRQWQILSGKGCEYSIETRVDLFCALIGLYNFTKEAGEDNGEDDFVLEDKEQDVQVRDKRVGQTEGAKRMDKKRDKIAAVMWTDY